MIILKRATVFDFETYKYFFETEKFNWLYYDNEEESLENINLNKFDDSFLKEVESYLIVDLESYKLRLSNSYIFIILEKKQPVGIIELSGKRGKIYINEWSMLPEVSKKLCFKKILHLRSPHMNSLTAKATNKKAEEILLSLGFMKDKIRNFYRFQKIKEA